MKLVFKNWLQFGEFMNCLSEIYGREVTQADVFEFDQSNGNLTVLWPNTDALPHAALVEYTEWFETL